MTDDLDRRLRARLGKLAQAVPVTDESAATIRLSDPATRSQVAGFSVLGTIVAAVIVVGLAIAVAGRDQPLASGSPTAGVATSPSATDASPSTATPTPLPTATEAPTPQPTRPPADVGLPYPDGCPAYNLSPRRCAYIVDWALREAGVPGDGATVQLLGDPECVKQPADCHSIVRLGGGDFVVRVRVVPATGKPSDHSVFCGGFGTDATMLCTDTPVIRVSSPTNGYHDVPCGPAPGGEPGSHCATPLPTIAPAAAEKAVPLRVPSVTIAIDHAGTYAIDVGDAVLPNGILSEATATLADDHRTDVLIPNGIWIEIVGPDGKPLDNAYIHGWHSGTETVHVRLVFSVESFDPPGTTLEITNVVVR